MSVWKSGGLTAAVLLGSSLVIGHASAMPANGLATAGGQVADGIETAAYVCGPYRCWWRPGPYFGPHAFGYVGPHHYWWGWHRHGW
jgi:hypothetical protein